jgi:hypothetical protein
MQISTRTKFLVFVLFAILGGGVLIAGLKMKPETGAFNFFFTSAALFLFAFVALSLTLKDLYPRIREKIQEWILSLLF